MSGQVMTSALRDPLAVEFVHAGGWHPGVLLGWRHDGPDVCRLRVQCVVGGLRHTLWMSLADLRLAGPAAASPVDEVLSWPRRPAGPPTDPSRPRPGSSTGGRPLTSV
jgi:hypothetical protein